MNSLFLRLYHSKKCLPEDERRYDRMYSGGIWSMFYATSCSLLLTKLLFESNLLKARVRAVAYFGGILAVGTVNIVRLATKADVLLQELDGKYQQLGFE